jgi:uncharacterized protein (DUF1330 family)
MATGVIVIIENRDVTNDAEMAAYRAGATAQLIAMGVKVLARGGTPVEGGPPLENVVITQWPSEDGFWAWYNSDEYAPLKAQRQAVSNNRLTLIPLFG